MDPLTQAVVGGLAAQSLSKPGQLAKAATVGALAGMAPDLDVLIRSSTDPLLSLEYHRQFTHSLLFIPIGGLLCALLLYPLIGRRWHLSGPQLLLWCLLGFGSHGLLDACTSYGTQLLWPFSDHRFAWDMISVIDPLFTLPLLLALVLAAVRHWRLPLQLGLLWGACYLGLGLLQQERALALGESLAAARGHSPVRMEVKPGFANLAVWKLVYEAGDRYYIAAIRPGWSEARVWPGDSIPKLKLERDLPWLEPDSQQARDIKRFRHFSNDFIALDRHHEQRVVDIRYSMLPHRIEPLWGIQLNPAAAEDQHAHFYTDRKDSQSALDQLLAMIFR